MPSYYPPPHYKGMPCQYVAAAGTRFFRVHRGASDSCGFSSLIADPHFGGSRFDPTVEGEFSYLYAADSRCTAVAETLLRDLNFDERGSRLLPRVAVKGCYLSEIELTSDLTLLALRTGAELAAVGQDDWLIHCGEAEYSQTRRWGRWLREQAPWAQGIIWPSRRDMGGTCVILFGDRCATQSVRPDGSSELGLEGTAGARWLKDVLAPLRVTVRLPRQLTTSRAVK